MSPASPPPSSDTHPHSHPHPHPGLLLACLPHPPHLHPCSTTSSPRACLLHLPSLLLFLILPPPPHPHPRLRPFLPTSLLSLPLFYCFLPHLCVHTYTSFTSLSPLLSFSTILFFLLLFLIVFVIHTYPCPILSSVDPSSISYSNRLPWLPRSPMPFTSFPLLSPTPQPPPVGTFLQ